MGSFGRSKCYGKNASRNLYKHISRRGRTIPIKITKVPTPVKVNRLRKVFQKPWPVLHLSEWVRACFELFGGCFLLGGFFLTDLGKVEDVLERFWQRYSKVANIEIPFPKRTIPWMLHGDEGRGQVKRPLLVISFQPVIGWAGEENLNTKKILG